MSNVASSEWTQELSNALQSNEDVRSNASNWTQGPIALVIDADDAKSFERTTVVFDVKDGTVTASVDERLTPFAFGGSLDRWQAVFGGSSTMVDAALESKLHVRGDLPTLVRHRGLLDAIAQAASGMATTWPEAPEPAKA